MPLPATQSTRARKGISSSLTTQLLLPCTLPALVLFFSFLAGLPVGFLRGLLPFVPARVSMCLHVFCALPWLGTQVPGRV